ncbi:MAG: hypothetical protein ACTSRU_13160 [Candidatus Hodarchaeales archaeon]
MQESYNPRLIVIIGITSVLVYVVHFIIELSGVLHSLVPPIPSLARIIPGVVWRGETGDLLSALAALTIVTVFIVGIKRILIDDLVDSGVTFIVVGNMLATVLGLLFLSLNLTGLLGAVVTILGNDQGEFDWSFTLYGPMITWLMVLPSLYGVKYLKKITVQSEQ